MIEIAVFSGYGAIDKLDSRIKAMSKGSWTIDERIKLAEYLKANSKEINYDNSDEASKVPGLYRMKNKHGSESYINSVRIGSIVEFTVMTIENIDTDRMWRIREYDGAESIEYYSEPEIIDSRYNYAKW